MKGPKTYDDWKLDNPEDEAEEQDGRRRAREARDRRAEERWESEREDGND